jgi:putative protease
MTQPIPELLAPAGDIERMRIAFAYGADAVYAGQPAFSLRGRENGFKTVADLGEGIREAHALGKLFFVASNLFPHNAKVGPFQRALSEIIEQGPDALIMADPGMIAWVRHEFPKVPVHLSVQSHALNWITCKFWHDLGVERVILARELKLREITEIREQVPGLELEVFVHGAVCMASSGRCMISNYMEYRDANQGNCNNACRFPFELTATSPDLPPGESIRVTEDEHGTYLFNARDLCALPILEQVVASGVQSLKIEGRTRSPYYLAQVVRGYRLALDAIAQGQPIPPEALAAVHATDARGWMSGFYTSDDPLPQNLEADRSGALRSEVVAQIREWDPARSRLRISVRNRIMEGETLELLTPHGTKTITATNLVNQKGQKTEKLHSGLENCYLDCPENPPPHSFLVRHLF